MLNYLIRFSFCLFSVCFYFIFIIILLYIIFFIFSQYNHPHTRYLAGLFCLLLCFVCFFVLKRELVFGFPYFRYFYLLVSVFLSQLSTELFCSFVFSHIDLLLSLIVLSRSRSLAIARPSVSVPSSCPRHHQHIMLLILRLRWGCFPLTFTSSFFCRPPACHPAHTTYTT